MPKFMVLIDETITYTIMVDAATSAAARIEADRLYNDDEASQFAGAPEYTDTRVCNESGVEIIEN